MNKFFLIGALTLIQGCAIFGFENEASISYEQNAKLIIPPEISESEGVDDTRSDASKPSE